MGMSAESIRGISLGRVDRMASTLPRTATKPLLWRCLVRRSITLINAVEGRIRKTIHSHKYGCGMVRYTHHDQVRLLGQGLGRCEPRSRPGPGGLSIGDDGKPREACSIRGESLQSNPLPPDSSGESEGLPGQPRSVPDTGRVRR